MAQKALQHQMTRVVRVLRTKLIDTLKENRQKHLDEFNLAVAGYKDVATGKLAEAAKGIHIRVDEQILKVQNKIDTFSQETMDEFYDYLTLLEAVTVELTVPKSFVEAYDTAIAMFEFETRDEVELSGAEFQCFCLDMWDWTYQFSVSNSAYTKGLHQ
jgi:hypothetical protein